MTASGSTQKLWLKYPALLGLFCVIAHVLPGCIDAFVFSKNIWWLSSSNSLGEVFLTYKKTFDLVEIFDWFSWQAASPDGLLQGEQG